MTCTAARHLGAIEMLWLHFQDYEARLGKTLKHQEYKTITDTNMCD